MVALIRRLYLVRIIWIDSFDMSNPWVYFSEHFPNFSTLIGDKAYPNIEIPPNWMLYITKTGEKTFLDGSYSEGGEKSHVIFNPAIAQYRSVVERTFQKLKKYRILESSWNSNLITCKAYFTIVCAIMNFIQQNKNKKFQQL